MEGFIDGSGLFGVVRHQDAAHLTWLGLHALQHRGGGGAALAASDGDLLRYRHGMGPVGEALPAGVLASLSGGMAVGQVYGRERGAVSPLADLYPGERLLFGRWSDGQIAIALSGRFTNGTRLRRELQSRGALLRSGSDAEVLAHLLAQSAQRTFINRLVDALWKVEGAFSVLVCTEDMVVAVRDPRGFRPLLVGSLGEATLLSTEDTAIRCLGGEVQRELAPGEMWISDPRGAQTVRPFAPQAGARCLQELVALARSDARTMGQHAYDVRVGLGTRLAQEAPCPEAQVVVGVPGAGEALGIGFGRAARLPVEQGLIALSGPTQVDAPASGLRDLGVRLRFSAVPSAVRERSVVLVAPSLVTGQGLQGAVRLLKEAGAREVHLRVGSPVVRNSCFYGVSSPTVDELIARRDGSLSEALGVQTVAALSLGALLEHVGWRTTDTPSWCHACFDGTFPLPPEEPDDQLPLF